MRSGTQRKGWPERKDLMIGTTKLGYRDKKQKEKQLHDLQLLKFAEGAKAEAVARTVARVAMESFIVGF